VHSIVQTNISSHLVSAQIFISTHNASGHPIRQIPKTLFRLALSFIRTIHSIITNISIEEAIGIYPCLAFAENKNEAPHHFHYCRITNGLTSTSKAPQFIKGGKVHRHPIPNHQSPNAPSYLLSCTQRKTGLLRHRSISIF
jgi:hypothetical protein